MYRVKLLLLPLALVFPFERMGTILLIIFFSIEFLTYFYKMNSRFSFKIFLHPIILLFFSTLFLLKFRGLIGPWDRDLSLLLFPVYFSLKDLNKEDVNTILKGYVWFLFLGLVFSICYEFILQFFYNDFINLWKLKEHYNNSKLFYFIHSVSERIMFHHIYLSLYLFVGFIIGHYLLYNKYLTNKNEILYTKISMVVFFLFTFLSISRMSIICFSLYGLLYLLNFKIKINKIFKLILVTIPVILLLYIFANPLKSRFNKISEDPRINLYNLSIKISKKAPLFGYGYQEGQLKLIDEQKKLDNIVTYNNSHNQFLDYLIGGGIVMVLVFIYVIVILIRYYYKSNLLIGVILLSFFIFQSLTEALLERYRGIVLFSFLTSLFYFMSSKKYQNRLNNFNELNEIN